MPEALIPTPPSVNSLYRNVPKIGRVKTKGYMTWLNVAVPILRAEIPRIDGSVAVFLQVSDKHTGDIDNRIKAALDALVTAERIQGDDKRTVRAVSAIWVSHLPKGQSCIMLLQGKK